MFNHGAGQHKLSIINQSGPALSLVKFRNGKNINIVDNRVQKSNNVPTIQYNETVYPEEEDLAEQSEFQEEEVISEPNPTFQYPKIIHNNYYDSAKIIKFRNRKLPIMPKPALQEIIENKYVQDEYNDGE